LASQLAGWLVARNVPFSRGKAWTTDAPYRETLPKLSHFLAARADVVEMEASAMFNFARFRKVSLASVLVIGDSLADGVWHPAFNATAVQTKSLDLAQELLAFLLAYPI
jgi:purine-nucleoside phosphorylase